MTTGLLLSALILSATAVFIYWDYQDREEKREAEARVAAEVQAAEQREREAIAWRQAQWQQTQQRLMLRGQALIDQANADAQLEEMRWANKLHAGDQLFMRMRQ